MILKLLINAPTVFLPEAPEIFEYLNARIDVLTIDYEHLISILNKWFEDAKIVLQNYRDTGLKSRTVVMRWFQNPSSKESIEKDLEYYHKLFNNISTLKNLSKRILGDKIVETMQLIDHQVQQGLSYFFMKWTYRFLAKVRDIQTLNLAYL